MSKHIKWQASANALDSPAPPVRPCKPHKRRNPDSAKPGGGGGAKKTTKLTHRESDAEAEESDVEESEAEESDAEDADAEDAEAEDAEAEAEDAEAEDAEAEDAEAEESDDDDETGETDEAEETDADGEDAEAEPATERAAPLDKSELMRLVNACGHDAIVAELAECAEYEAAGTKAQKGAQVKAKYKKNVQLALAYFGKYFFVEKGSDVTYVHVDYDAEGREAKETRYKSAAAFLRNWTLFYFESEAVSKRRVHIAPLWLESKDRRTYDEAVFQPGAAARPYVPWGHNVRNTWTGWAFAKDAALVADEARIAPITAHLREVVCSGDAKLYTYLLKHMKLVLLGKKTGVALCLTGAQGAGKSAIVEYFGEKIVGDQYYAYFEGLERLMGQFNTLRCHKSWVVCDEITSKPSINTANRLKSMVTGARTTREGKGDNAGNVDDYANFCLVSNHKDFIKVEGKGDRRYCVIPVSGHKKGDFVYFDKLYVAMGIAPKSRHLTPAEEADAREVARHFFHFVMNQDTEGFQPEDFPRTEMRRDMEAAATPPLSVFMRWFLGECQRKLGGGVKVPPTQVYQNYKALFHARGGSLDYTAASSLSKAVRSKFQGFESCDNRNGQSRFFVASPAAVADMIKELDDTHTFDKDILDGSAMAWS